MLPNHNNDMIIFYFRHCVLMSDTSEVKIKFKLLDTLNIAYLSNITSYVNILYFLFNFFL